MQKGHVNIEIDFAYRTFKWHNEAKHNAAVHCVIVGFSAKDAHNAASKNRIIVDGETVIHANHINGYLIDAPDVIIESRSKSICDVPQMVYGNKPTDGGNLIFTPEEKDAFLASEPQAEPFFKKLLGAEEFLNGKMRYCLWLANANPTLINKCPNVKARIEAVRQMRLSSKAEATRNYAPMGGLFRQITQPEGKDYILVPRVSSQRREYLPIDFLTADTKVTDLVQIIPDASIYHFAILTSRIHNAWMRAVTGRLKSDYRYLRDIVYNNFIWPTPSEELKQKIEDAARRILEVRSNFFGADAACTFAILYNPETMPPELVKAHAHLDALVDKAYGRTFANDNERVAHLFNLYAEAVKG